MEELIDVIGELWTADGGGPVQQFASKTYRVLYDATHGGFIKGTGPATWSLRGIDFLLDRAGVPPDHVTRIQIRRELTDIDKHGPFGMRILEPDVEPPHTSGPVMSEPPPHGDPKQGHVWGVMDP